jgi:hypothetical protein
MYDPVFAIIMKAGSLSLRELFARAGADDATRLRVANLLKNGEVRFEPAEGGGRLPDLPALDVDRLSEQEIAANFNTISDSTAESVAISPTAKAWRNPFL